MQLNVKLVQVLPLQTGQGRNGTPWKKQDIIVETDGQYPKKICVSIWGDKINESQLKMGNMLKIDFDVESREYNGRWYTDVKAWKVETDGEGMHSGGSSNGPIDPFPPPQMDTPAAGGDDLPF
jgi:hypothetical protein